MDKISIIGLGKLGSNLYFALKKAGYKQIFKINKKTGKKYLKFALQNSNIIFICTKDSDISNVVKLLRPLVSSANAKIIYHTSGALNSETLKPLKNKKISAGSFHPVQTFNSRVNRYSDKFRGIFIAIEGDNKSIEKGISIAKKLGSNPFIIRGKNKVFHHINSVIASNYLVTLIHQISKNFNKSSKLSKKSRIFINGFKNVEIFDIYEPLIRTTINNIGLKGVLNSLTGPVERYDYKTIELHLLNLKEMNHGLLDFYIYMGKETTKLALIKKSITKDEAEKLTDLFKKYSTK